MKDVSLKPVEPKDWPADLSAAMRNSVTADGDTIGLFKVLAGNPGLFLRVIGGFAGGLDLIDRETVVLRTLLRCQNHYEKWYHKRFFLRSGGNQEVLEGLLDPGLGTLTGKPRALARAVDETLEYRRIGPETLETLSEWFDGALVLEILDVVARYSFLTTVINTAEIPLDPRAEAISDEMMTMALADQK